jgi:hypothetical protein
MNATANKKLFGLRSEKVRNEIVRWCTIEFADPPKRPGRKNTFTSRDKRALSALLHKIDLHLSARSLVGPINDSSITLLQIQFGNTCMIMDSEHIEHVRNESCRIPISRLG